MRTVVILSVVGFVATAHAKVDCRKEFEKARTLDQYEKLLLPCPEMVPKIKDAIGHIPQRIELQELEAQALLEVRKTGTHGRYWIPLGGDPGSFRADGSRLRARQ